MAETFVVSAAVLSAASGTRTVTPDCIGSVHPGSGSSPGLSAARTPSGMSLMRSLANVTGLNLGSSWNGVGVL
ncbi:hypothetical protein LT337_01355 [Mycolicibacterium fortuitum]|nr:hypothetical protein LT337_01355 [Mycolicibacterium fortuitum]